MKPGRSVEDWLQDIVVWGERVGRHIDGFDSRAFRNDEIIQDAISKCVEAIGEASGRLIEAYPEFAQNHPQLDLRSARDTRNRLAHGYFSVNLDTLWDTVKIDVPALIAEAARLLRKAREAE